jgi:hypothetical protein
LHLEENDRNLFFNTLLSFAWIDSRYVEISGVLIEMQAINRKSFDTNHEYQPHDRDVRLRLGDFHSTKYGFLTSNVHDINALFLNY